MKKITALALAISILIVPILLLTKRSAEDDQNRRYDTSDHISDEAL